VTAVSNAHTIVNGLRISSVMVYLIKYSRANRTSHKTSTMCQ